MQQETPKMPGDIEIISFLGKGNRAYVYKAKLDDKDIVVKLYKKNVIEKYKSKYKVDIAEFEAGRNEAMYNIDEIRGFIAKPYRVYSSDSEFSHSIVQEFVTGVTLEELIGELGYLPEKILEIGYQVVKCAEENGIHDLDISVGNVMAHQFDGKWKLTLYDFNIMPQYLYPPNPIMALAFKAGIRKKSYRDYRSLRNWDRRGKQKRWIGRN